MLPVGAVAGTRTNAYSACRRAAAQATGCEVDIAKGRLIMDLRQCKPLAEQYSSTLKELYGIECENKYHDWSSGGASTDFGNVS